VEEYEITCVKQDFFENITHVEINGRQYRSETVVQWLQDKKYDVYTIKNGQKTYVHAKKSMLYGWFLTTDSQSSLANNLQFLCSY
jgi:hypothetical protein